jgi:hypothetical protein
MDKLWVYVTIGHRFKYLYSSFVLVLMILLSTFLAPATALFYFVHLFAGSTDLKSSKILCIRGSIIIQHLHCGDHVVASMCDDILEQLPQTASRFKLFTTSSDL